MRQTALMLPAVAVLLGSMLCADGRSANEVMKGDTTTLYTGYEYGYNNFWIEMYQRDFIVFSVKACTDVHIALIQERFTQEFNFTEVVIGGWYNSKSVFRNGAGNKAHYVDFNTPAILHCAEFRQFWISWADDTLRTGRGPLPGEQTFMFLPRMGAVAHAVNFVGFSTGWGARGEWQLVENQGYYIVLDTPDDFRYQFMWKTTDYKYRQFNFWVRAKHDVHINLSPNAGQVYYEIYIGGYGNTRSALRYGGSELIIHMENDIVSETEFRGFWITWFDGRIRCGKGSDYGLHTFLDWTDPQFVGINHLSVATGYGSNGTWVFNDNLENSFRYNTYVDSSTAYPVYTQFITTVRRQRIFIEANACSDVWFILTTTPATVDDMSLQIYIGINNNTKSGIRDHFSVTPIVEVTHAAPGVLSCTQPRPLWVTWYNRTVRVGLGHIYGVNEFMSADISNYDPYHGSIGFANTGRSGEHYLIRRNAGDSLYMQTAETDPMGRMMLSVNQDVYLIFSVQACRNAHLILAGIRGVFDRDAYEIIIGWNGFQTVIRDRVGGGNQLVTANTPDILSCTEPRWFWLGWLDGILLLGPGQRFGQNILLHLLEPMPHATNYITLQTNGVPGIWEFEGDRGDHVLLDLFNASMTKWLYFEPNVNWFYFEVTGSEIHLMLTTMFQDLTQVYHVYIGSKDNVECSLWKKGSLLQSKIQPGLLDPVEPRDFWLSWAGGRFQLGTSKFRGMGVSLIDYTDSSPYIITSLGVEAVINTNRAEIKIWDNTAVELMTTTYNPAVVNTPIQPFQLWRSTRHRTWIMFGLKACARAEVALTIIPHTMLVDFSYLIEIQNENDQTVIWEGLRNKALSVVDTPNMLNCDVEHHFWISWLGGHIVLGRGQRLGLRSLVSYVDMNELRIDSVAFNSISNQATWRMPLAQDEFPTRRQVFMDPGLSGGEVAGVVFGALFLLALIVGLAYVVVRQPQPIARILNPSGVSYDSPDIGSTSINRTASSSRAATSTGASNVVSFSNPLDEFAEVQIKES